MPRKQVTETNPMRFWPREGEENAMNPRKPLEASESQAGARAEQRRGLFESGITNDGMCGEVAGTSGAPAAVEKPVLDQSGVELLARDFQQLGSISLVMAGYLQSPFDQLALGLIEGLGRGPTALARRHAIDLGRSSRPVEQWPRGPRLVSTNVLRQVLQTDPGTVAKGD